MHSLLKLQNNHNDVYAFIRNLSNSQQKRNAIVGIQEQPIIFPQFWAIQQLKSHRIQARILGTASDPNTTLTEILNFRSSDRQNSCNKCKRIFGFFMEILWVVSVGILGFFRRRKQAGLAVQSSVESEEYSVSWRTRWVMRNQKNGE